MDNAEDNVSARAVLVDHLPCGAALLDESRCFVAVNAQLAEMTGRSMSELQGAALDSLFSDDTRAHVHTLLNGDGDGVESIESALCHRDGNAIPAILAARRMSDGDGRSSGWIITATDISLQKESFQEVANISDTVLQEALRFKGLSDFLEQRVRQRTAELHDANMDAIVMLAVASEARDEDTGVHVRRIQRSAQVMAIELGLPLDEAERIGYSAVLHDVGKIHVPDRILKKPAALTEDERVKMEQHTIIGERILSGKPFFATAHSIARHHHENWDGSGYPDRLAGQHIPLAARIVHVVDVYDALTHDRVYKSAWPQQQAVQAIRDGAGSLFEPELVRVFISLHKSGEFKRINEET